MSHHQSNLIFAYLLQSNVEQKLIVSLKHGTKLVCDTMEGVLHFFNWKEFGNMSDRFPGHPGSIECMACLDELLLMTGCEDGKIRFVHLDRISIEV